MPLLLLLLLPLLFLAASSSTASAALDVAQVGVPISISIPDEDDGAADSTDSAANADASNPLARATVTLCALDWAAYRADPSAAPMFRDVVALSHCSTGKHAKTVVSFAALEDEYQKRACGDAALSPPPPSAAGTPAGFQGAGCVPTGLVLHQSRCGSTLVANMLASLPSALIYSEAAPPQTILTHARLSERDRVRALRVVVAAMGRPVRLHTMGREVPHANGVAFHAGEDPDHPLLPPPWQPEHMFFKLQSATTMHLATLRRAFPSTPWAFVHRDGTEVLASLLRGAVPREAAADADGGVGVGGGLDPHDQAVLEAPCMRSRDSEQGPPEALMAATGASTREEAAALPPEAYCAASVGLLAASALHHALEARRAGLTRAGLLPVSGGAAGGVGGHRSNNDASSTADFDVGDGEAVARLAASSSSASVVALGGMLLDVSAGRGVIAGVGQGVFVDYNALPDAAVALARSHFGLGDAFVSDEEGAPAMLDASTRYSKARMGLADGGKGGGGGGGRRRGGAERSDTAALPDAADPPPPPPKRRSRRQEEEGHRHPEEETTTDSTSKQRHRPSAIRARPGMAADGSFVGDSGVKREKAWPELKAAADRYVSGVRAALLRFNTPADGAAAAAADPALQALLRAAYGAEGTARAEATVAAALGPKPAPAAADEGDDNASSSSASTASGATTPAATETLPGPLAAAALGLYARGEDGNGENADSAPASAVRAHPLEVGFSESRHVLPLGQGYPMLFPLVAILAEWSPDVTAVPPTYGRYSSLRYFDWRTERNEAEAFRRAEVPFVVRGVPSLVAAAQKWARDDDLLRMMAADKRYEAQATVGTHFMYFVPPDKKKKGGAEEEKQPAADWTPPTEDARITPREWLAAAREAAAEVVAEERAALPAWWFASSPASSLFSSREDVCEAVPAPPNRKLRRLHYAKATSYPDMRHRKAHTAKRRERAGGKGGGGGGGESGGDGKSGGKNSGNTNRNPDPNNNWVLDELPLFDPVTARAYLSSSRARGGVPAAGDDGADALPPGASAPDPRRAADEAPFFIVDESQQRGVHCRFGMPGTIAESHYDGSRNFITMQRGRRRYILSPPTECANLALLTDGPSARHSEADWADPSQHALLANALALEVVLEPGDALYLPAAWFHYIVSLAGVNIQCNSRSGKPLLFTRELARCGFPITNTEPLGLYSDPDAASKQPDRARHAEAYWRPHWPSLRAIARGMGVDERVVVARRSGAGRRREDGEGGLATTVVPAERMTAAVAAGLEARAREYGQDVEASEAEQARAGAERRASEARRAAASAKPEAASSLPAANKHGSNNAGWGRSAEAVRARKAAIAAAVTQERAMGAVASAADWTVAAKHHERALRGSGSGLPPQGWYQRQQAATSSGGVGGGGVGAVRRLWARAAHALEGRRLVAGGVVGAACVCVVSAARVAAKRKRKREAKGDKKR